MTGSILVTGASGFVGTHLVRALTCRGYSVVTHSIADGDIESCELSFGDVRHVFHLAAKTFVPDSWADPLSFYRVNVMGMANVSEFCRRCNASLTFLSSYVYGEPERLPIGEEHPRRAFNPYSHSKILAEDVGRFYETSFRVPVTIVRPFNLYGPGQASQFLIPGLFQQALSPEIKTLSVADARPRRDYLFITDLTDFLIRLLERGLVGTFNAGSGTSVSVAEVAAIINSFLPVPKPFISRDEARTQEVLDTVADISKARRDAGWAPKISLETGLRSMVAAFAAPHS
jgi:nucleoside-diphosphate-sugar epimerase